MSTVKKRACAAAIAAALTIASITGFQVSWTTANAGTAVPLSEAGLTAEDMQEIGAYMDEDVNAQVYEKLGEAGTAEEWLAAYVAIDPEFNSTLMDVLGVYVKEGGNYGEN